MSKNKYFEYNQVKPVPSIKAMVQGAVDDVGDQVAYRYKLRSDGEIFEVTYREFQAQTFALGAALLERGYGLQDQHIGIVAGNSYNWIVTYLTVLQSAAVFVPLDNGLPVDELFYVLKASESQVLFYSKNWEKTLQEKREEIPFVKLFIGLDREEDEGDFLSFHKLLEHGRSLDPAAFRALETDHYGLKDLVFTSGTTGLAKGVMLSEHNLCSGVYNGLQVSTVWGTGLSVLPYHHTYEAVPGILIGIHKHVTMCLNESLFAMMKNMQTYKPNYIYLVPAFAEVFYERINKTIKETGKEKSFDKLVKFSNFLRKIGIDKRKKFFKVIHDQFGGNLEKIVCGGAPIRSEIGEFFDNIGITLMGGYGITECSPLVSVNPDSFIDWTTAGCRLPCIEWKIDQPNDEGIGEILIKGDVVMMGYYNDPEKTAEVLKDGWFYTGDYGYITPKDQLVITGRKKNLIVLSNGKNIYPEELENAIMALPEVHEVVVRGIRDEKGNETSLVAEIFLTEDYHLTEEEVLAKVQAILADKPSYKKISHVILRDEEFPKTTSRKIRR